MAPAVTGGQLPGGAEVRLVGAVQGLVIGDRNTVNQSFNLTRHEAYVAREHRPLPPHWVERAGLVARAAAALEPGAVVALCGMGGSGKSTLAGRIAAELAPRFDGGCFWIDLAAGDVDEALLRIALAFGHDISLLSSREARASTVRSLIAGRRVLFVLDDVWSVGRVEIFLPPPPSCAAVLTTRNDAVAASVASKVVPVDSLAAEDAVALLAAVSGCPASEPELAQVADALGGLPLALELAGKLARQQARRPGFAWPAFAAAFAHGDKRLGLGLAGTSVRAAFDATWEHALDDAVRHAFALLGIFAPGTISTAEAAAAWDADQASALGWLNDLIDLSLLRLEDPVTLSLHPLLADYARAMAEELAPDVRVAAHCRVSDHIFRIAPRPPRDLGDIALVLRAHEHAAKAGDRARADRVYPWFGDGERRMSVPGFLIDHGQYRTHVKHVRLEFELLQDASEWARAWACYRLGDALMRAGNVVGAEARIEEAIGLLESSGADERAMQVGLSKFLMGLGQTKSLLGKLDEAEAAFRRAVDVDRRTDSAGGVAGALEGALIGLLQLADLCAESDAPDGPDEAVRLCREVQREAAQRGAPQVAIMALARLAECFGQADPAQAIACLREAQGVAERWPGALEGRQGARYARRLAECADELAMNGHPTVDDALGWLRLAIINAGRCDAQQELGQALYGLGNLFEHYFLIGRESPLEAAWACYALAESCLGDAEGGAPVNAKFRIDQRVVPRIDASRRAEAAAAVASDPWGVIEEALAPQGLGWRPAH